MVVISLFYSGVIGGITNDLSPILFKRLSFYKVFDLSKLILMVVLSGIMLWIYFRSTNIYFYEYILWIGLLIIAIYLNPILIFEFKRLLLLNGIEMNTLSVYFIIAATNLFVFAGISGFNEVNKVKNHNYYKGTEFILEDANVIISNEQKYYIGKTKQFLFFYDSNKEETEVIPISNIKRMKYN